MKLMRLTNILKTKQHLIHIQNWMQPYEKNEENLLHLSTKLHLSYENSFNSKWLPQRGYRNKTACYNCCIFLQQIRSCKMWGLVCLSKPVAMGGPLPIKSCVKMHHSCDQPKQVQRDVLQALPAMTTCLKTRQKYKQGRGESSHMRQMSDSQSLRS